MELLYNNLATSSLPNYCTVIPHQQRVVGLLRCNLQLAVHIFNTNGMKLLYNNLSTSSLSNYCTQLRTTARNGTRACCRIIALKSSSYTYYRITTTNGMELLNNNLATSSLPNYCTVIPHQQRVTTRVRVVGLLRCNLVKLLYNNLATSSLPNYCTVIKHHVD